MKMNLHTHTWRCGHALKWEEDYVKTAIEEGFDILGFADHTPQFFPGDYYSNFRMRPELLRGYCNTVRELAKKYRDQIQIPLGLEVEYYPSLLPQLLSVIRDQLLRIDILHPQIIFVFIVTHLVCFLSLPSQHTKQFR